MPGILLHSPADILQSLAVANGWVTDPSLNQKWPGYVASEPIEPDDCVTFYDTQGMDDGVFNVSGQRQEHYGVQVRVRATDPQAGYVQANKVAVGMDGVNAYAGVTVDGSRYKVTSITRTTGVLPLGKELTTSKRSLFTFNALVTLHKL